MPITLNGTTGITNDAAYTGDGILFADGTPANTLVTTTSGRVGIGTNSPDYQLDVSGTSSSTTTLGVGISLENLSFTLNTRAGIVFRNGDNYGASIWSPRTGSSNGALVFGTNGGGGVAETNILERMRISSIGNVGIATIDPYCPLDVYSTGANVLTSLFTTGSTDQLFRCGFMNGLAGGTNTLQGRMGLFYLTSGEAATIGFVRGSGATNASITFRMAGIERARFDSNGHLNLGREGYVAYGDGVSITTDIISIGHTSGTAGGTGYMVFGYAGGSAGSITQVGTTAVSYNTSSDYRLKNVEGEITNSGSYIDSLRPVHGTWKADGSKFIGLIAHEVQEVSQTQVASGTKDQVDDKGKPVYQGMDYSNPEIIANLIAEVKSLRKRVSQLEGNQ